MICPRLKHKSSIPWGGGFELNLPEKGMVGRAINFETLVTVISKYRRANAIPIGIEFEDEVEREICLRWPQECKETDARVPNRELKLGFQEVIQGTRAMIAHKLAGSPLETQDEANRRALICAKCPNNVSVHLPCSGICGELQTVVNAIVGAKGTPYDGSLKSCAICGCWLTASVWVPTLFQWQALSAAQKASFRLARDTAGCWKTDESS